MQTTIFCAASLALLLSCVSATPFSAQSRIIGGKDANAAPFIVSLQWATAERRNHFCAAAIIGDNVLLTAAHCIQALPADSMIKAVAGRHNLHAESTESSEEEVLQVRFVTHIELHENFTGGISADDIAVLKVSESFDWTETVQPIDLPRTKEMITGEVTIYGWGSTSEDFDPEYPDTLQMVNTQVIGYEECEKSLGGEGATPLKKSNLCTGPLEGGVSACHGDSGGPLVKTDADGHNTLVGIVSWGFFPCGGPNSPSIYARVSAYTAWIEEMKK